MRTIWLDVTTMLGWHRPAVGIVRTEAECAAYALKCGDVLGARARFCRFDAVQGYSEVDAVVLQAALDRIEGKLPADNKAAAPPAAQSEPAVLAVPAVPLETRLKALVLGLIGKLPERLRVLAFRFATQRRESFGAALRGLRELRHALKTFVRPPQSALITSQQPVPNQVVKRAPAPFLPDDVYVSMGLDWDQKDLAYLYAQKRAVGFKVLLFCYDVIPVKLPHLCVGNVAAFFAHYFANAAWCADEILCISECSRKDLGSLLADLGAPVPRLSVIKLGCQLPVAAAAVVGNDVAAVLTQRYVLFVSTIERRKNHETIYRAYAQLLEQGVKDLPLLVFVGMPGWGVGDLMADLRFDPRTRPFIKMLNHVTDAELAKLYSQALLTVFPSLYEGWGLPVAESLAAGKFCLASNAASIPEVGGDLIEYIDPWHVSAWAERLQWYFSHPEDLAAKEARIKLCYKPTPWPVCAQHVLAHAARL